MAGAGGAIDRDGLRALAFLARGGARLEARATRVFLVAEGRGQVAVARKALTRLEEARMVYMSGDEAMLTPAGRDGLARLRATRRDAPRPEGAARTESGVIVNGEESPLAQLGRLKTRKGEPFLTPAEWRAGERLRADYTRAGMMPRLGANWEAAVSAGRRSPGPGDAIDLRDGAIAARQRVGHALDAVGPELSGVLVDICCFLKGLTTVEIERGWPVRSAKVVLKTALAALSRHYEPETNRSRRPILAWGASGFRPAIDGSRDA